VYEPAPLNVETNKVFVEIEPVERKLKGFTELAL
jgi:hypothetical protein